MNRAYYTKEKEIVDCTTGETILETSEKHFLIKEETEDAFFKMYINAMPLLHFIKGVSMDILVELMMRAEFNTGIIKIPTGEKYDIIKSLGISLSSYTNTMALLKKKKILKELKAGVYELNPQIFWKGDKETRKRLIENGMIITFVENSQDLENYIKTNNEL